MSIEALITEGIGPGGSILYAMTGGLDLGGAPPVVVTAPTQGMGPGWHLFGQPHQPSKVHVHDNIADDIRRALEKAEEAQSPRALREAVKDLKSAASEVVTAAQSDETAQLARFAQNLERALRLQGSAAALLKDIRAALELERAQQEDDLEAFMILAELI